MDIKDIPMKLHNEIADNAQECAIESGVRALLELVSWQAAAEILSNTLEWNDKRSK